MAKLSDKINLSEAIKEAQKSINGNDSVVEQNVANSPNSEAKVSKQKGKKKEKATSNPVPEEENSLFADLIPQEKPKPKEEKWPKSYEEVCEYEIRRAHEMGYPDPDFDFRTIYSKGQKVWFVSVQEELGEKEVVELVLRTIYARTLIGSQPKGMCYYIGHSMQDQIFLTRREANTFYDSLKIKSKYAPEKKIRKEQYKDSYDEDEEDDMPSSQESLEELMSGKDVKED